MKTLTPIEIFSDLFVDLQMYRVHDDAKQISDAIPMVGQEEILFEYGKLKTKNFYTLSIFFNKYFKLNKAKIPIIESYSDPEKHVHSLWKYLYRENDISENGSTKIALPYPYVVPGGRFNEMYYWDSYFTMLGLVVENKWDWIESMLDNFSWMLDQFDLIPNGNRSYFLSRSQPPFFASMIELLSLSQGKKAYLKYLPALEKEYAFWMKHKLSVNENSSSNHCVRFKDKIVNRYFDKDPTPRQEMYYDDVILAKASSRNDQSLFASLRAACESGWDFSSRWFEDALRLNTCQCDQIIPIDLNCLVWNMERVLAKMYKLNDQDTKAIEFTSRAEERAVTIRTEFWNKETQTFSDINITNGLVTQNITAASLYPLFFKIASPEQASHVADCLSDHLLAAGGLLTTNVVSGQQWDAPNGWAPLQWIAIRGLRNYGLDDLADEINRRWTTLVEQVFKRTGRFTEKYNVIDLQLEAGGGEYKNQDGFGWTNGVYLACKNEVYFNNLIKNKII